MKLAVIRVRGTTGVRSDIEDTMKMLRLYKKNFMVILEKNAVNEGKVERCKDYVTWGEVNEETLKKLTAKLKDAKFYRLNSPKKGYGRKGIKTSFKAGGALGYRGEKINDLIMRML